MEIRWQSFASDIIFSLNLIVFIEELFRAIVHLAYYCVPYCGGNYCLSGLFTCSLMWRELLLFTWLIIVSYTVMGTIVYLANYCISYCGGTIVYMAY